MKTLWFRMLLVATLAAALLAPAVAGAHGHEGGQGSSGMEDDHSSSGSEFEEMMESIEELKELDGDEFEIAYINRIVPHHEGALEMAQMVVERAPHQEVRDAAGKIIEDQKAEIEMLTTYLRDTHGQELDRDERQVMSHDMMQELETSDPEMAETMFLLMMREHHETAVIMGEIVLGKDVSDEIRQQAEGMVSSQKAEQEQFAEWLKMWYGIDVPEPTGDMMKAMEFAMGTDMPDTGAGGLASSRDSYGILLLGIAATLTLLLSGYILRRRLI